MPLWNIYHTPGIFTDEQKHTLSQRISQHYVDVGLPRFYVITLFTEMPTENVYVGGEPNPVVVRITIDHIARRSTDKKHRRQIAHWINGMLQPYFSQHPQLHSEFHVDETSEDLWMINGLLPPPEDSDAEREWARANATSKY